MAEKLNIGVAGTEKIEHQIKEFLEGYITRKIATIGIHSGKGSQIHPDSKMTVAAIGAINHFGAGKIPARPWLDVGVMAGKDKIVKAIHQTLKHGKSADQALLVAANLAVGSVQQYITDLQTPPNAPSTIARKGSSNPLIDTGLMRQSVTYQIHQKGAKK